MITYTLKWMGREVYGAFLPLDAPHKLVGAENYLPDIFRSTTFSVGASHTLLCVAVFFLPVFSRFLRPLGLLTREEKDRFVTRLLTSPLYLFRLIGYGVKGHALVAVLREPVARQAITKMPGLRRQTA